MAEVSSVDAWNLSLIESDRKFYTDLNEIRVMRNMAPIVPSYDWMKSKPKPVIPDLKPKQPWKESFEDTKDSVQKLRDAAKELKATFSQLVDDFKKYREEIEASKQMTDSCEESLDLLQENTDDSVKMADTVIAQDSELGSLANSREHYHGVLEASPAKLNWEINLEARDLSFSNNFEFRGNNPSLNLELPVFRDFIWARQCEKYSRNYGIADARHMFEKMPVRGFICSDYSVQVSNGQVQLGNRVFDPGARVVDGLQKTSNLNTTLPKFGPGSTMTPNCKCYGQFDGLEGHSKCFYVDRFDGLNKHAVEKLNFDLNVENYDYFEEKASCVFDPGIDKGLNYGSASLIKQVVMYLAPKFPRKQGVYLLAFDLGGSWLCSMLIFGSCVDVVMLCNKGNKGSDFSFEVKGLVFDPGGRCLHQMGCLRLDGGCTEGLQLLRSIWLIAWSQRRCKIMLLVTKNIFRTWFYCFIGSPSASVGIWKGLVLKR